MGRPKGSKNLSTKEREKVKKQKKLNSKKSKASSPTSKRKPTTARVKRINKRISTKQNNNNNNNNNNNSPRKGEKRTNNNKRNNNNKNNKKPRKESSTRMTKKISIRKKCNSTQIKEKGKRKRKTPIPVKRKEITNKVIKSTTTKTRGGKATPPQTIKESNVKKVKSTKSRSHNNNTNNNNIEENIIEIAEGTYIEEYSEEILTLLNNNNNNSPILLTLYAEEICEAIQSRRWYYLGAPIFASRLQELFNRPLSNIYKSSLLSSSYNNNNNNNNSFNFGTISNADAAALGWLFPAIHNNEWFNTPWEFLHHFRSISHKLLCEKTPLFPLILLLSPKNIKNPKVITLTEKNKSEIIEMKTVKTSILDNNSNNNKYYYYYYYYWWFMHLHTSLQEFKISKNSTWMTMMKLLLIPFPFHNNYFNDFNNLKCIGEAWYHYRIFLINISSAVTRRIVLSPGPQWYSLLEATCIITNIIKSIYDKGKIEENKILEFNSCAPFTSDLLWNNEAQTSSINAAFTFISNNNNNIEVKRREAIVQLSLYLALIIVKTIHKESCIPSSLIPIVNIHFNDNFSTNKIKSSSLLSPLLSTLHNLNTDDLFLKKNNNNDMEENIMELVLWLYLNNASTATTTKISR